MSTHTMEDLRIVASREYPELRGPKEIREYTDMKRRGNAMLSLILGAIVTLTVFVAMPATLKPYAFMFTIVIDMCTAIYLSVKNY